MAYEGRQFTIPGAVSGEDLSAATVAFKFVKWDTVTGAPNVVLCDNIADLPCGVIQAPTPTAAEGQPVNVCMYGVTKIQVDGTVVKGALIGVNANSRAVTLLWGTDTTAFVTGVLINQDTAAAVPAGGLATAVINCINPPLAVTSA